MMAARPRRSLPSSATVYWDTCPSTAADVVKLYNWPLTFRIRKVVLQRIWEEVVVLRFLSRSLLNGEKKLLKLVRVG